MSHTPSAAIGAITLQGFVAQYGDAPIHHQIAAIHGAAAFGRIWMLQTGKGVALTSHFPAPGIEGGDKLAVFAPDMAGAVHRFFAIAQALTARPRLPAAPDLRIVGRP